MCDLVLIILYFIINDSPFVEEVVLYHLLCVIGGFPVRQIGLEPERKYLALKKRSMLSS